ncbi:MAG: M48 family metalloprotease [Phycisphaerales bacterium]
MRPAARRSALLLAVPLVAGCASTAPVATPPPDVMQVSSAVTVVFERPDARSKMLARLPEGACVRVVERGAMVRIPAGAMMNEAFPGEEIPAWVRVEAGRTAGWVPARSLIDPVLRAQGGDALALERRTALTSGEAPKPGSPRAIDGAPDLADSDEAAADAVIAFAAVPPRFVRPAGDPFAGPVRDAALAAANPPALETLDPALAARVAEASTEAADIIAPEFNGKGPGHLWGALTIGVGDAAGVTMAVDALVEDATRPRPFTPADERVLGRACLAACLHGAATLPPEDARAAYVSWVGTRVAAASTAPFPSIGLAFVVVEGDAPAQAIAIPGGPVVVSAGQLRSLRNEHELAIVLARAVARVEARHGRRAALAAGGDRFNPMLQVLHLEAAGALDATIGAALSEVPEDLLADAMARSRTRLLAFANDGYASVVRATLDSVQSPSADDAAAADRRARELVAAAGWNPRACDVPVPGARGGRWARLQALLVSPPSAPRAASRTGSAAGSPPG